MGSAFVPPDEERRIDALRQYDVLDTDAEPAFDDLARLAAHLCDAPVALISLVDEDRQWFKSHIGWSATETPRSISFCMHAIQHPEDLFIVSDASRDSRFANSPMVTGDPHAVFYAGTALVTATGDALGTLCIIDHKPRDLTPPQREALRVLGRQVMSQLELRRRTAELADRERLLRGIVDAEPECLKLLDIDGTLRMMNRAGLDMIEADSSDQVIGTCVYDVIAPEHRAAFSALNERVFAGHEGTLEFQVIGLKGGTRWLETHAAPLRNDRGQVDVALGVTRDITDRRMAVEALRESERTSRALFEQTTEGIFVTNDELRVVDVNTAACDITGYPREQLLSMHVNDLLMPEELQRVPTERARLESGNTAVSQWLLRHADGTAILAEARAKRLADGKTQTFLRDLTDRKVVEDALSEADEKLRRAVIAGHVGLWDWDLESGAVYYSQEWKRQIGYEDYEIRNELEEWRSRVHPDDLQSCLDAIDRFIRRMIPAYEVEFRFRHKNGSYRHILAQASLVMGDDGYAVGLRGSHVDITDRADLQAQFLQAQKMESVGRLAGGIAHDFNNLLTVINGTADLAYDALPEGDPMRADLEQIQIAGNRAANLTRQLLALSRQQILSPVVLDLRDVIGSMQSMLQRLIGEDVILHFRAPPSLGSIRADPSQIEQVILNLAVNARDAMPDGGSLTIELKDLYLDELFAAHHQTVVPGPHVMLAMSDTGIGMDEATRKRAFEPFFTAKKPGKGTGLGLSTVYGIVKQSGGTIWVYSEPGLGATFRVYLPRVEEAPLEQRPVPSMSDDRGTETIIIVEDERSLRSLCRRILQSAGYTVIEASSGPEALKILEDYAEPVDLMLTDVVMPGMNGRELAQKVMDLRPETRVLYTSGYTDDAILRHGVLDDASRFVAKPYTAEDLKRKVRSVLDR
jgi:two-component system, cell cycle sensor histidine kinase and response regulator CckA